MKKILSIVLVTVIMVMTTSITVFASGEYDVMPCYNNTITANSHFSIDENGLADISLRYVGYQACATSGTITCKIQKKTGSSWVDVSGASWVDETTGFMLSANHSFQLTSRGTYKLVYEYVVRGTGGADDVISGTMEDTY